MFIIQENITMTQFEDTALYPDEALYPDNALFPIDRTVGNYLYIRNDVTQPSLVLTENIVWNKDL